MTTQPATRASKCARYCVAILLTLAGVASPLRFLHADEVPDRIAGILVRGNETIPTSVILNQVLTQPNRNISNRQVREDIRRLMNTRWFYSVTNRFEETAEGPVLVFDVKERPIVRRVRFRGVGKSKLAIDPTRVKVKEVQSWTGLKPGSPFDHMANNEAAHRIEQEYKQKGYFFVKVKLLKGGDPQDREVIFDIDEGPIVRVEERRFEFVGGGGGNQMLPFLQRQSKDGSYGLSPSASRLKTKLVTKESWFGWFGGIYQPDTQEQDILVLKQYYRGLGFFDIAITAKEQISRDRSSVRLIYQVDEGVPYKVRSVKLNGNHVIPTARLRENAELRPGMFFNSRFLAKDVQNMLKLYGQRGHYLASVVPVPKFTEEKGILDLVFEIDEDRKRYVRSVNGRLRGEHPHTQTAVLKNLLQIEPGDLADPRLIQRGQSRLGGSGLFEANIALEVLPAEETGVRTVSGTRKIRGQNAGHGNNWTDQFASTGIGSGHSLLNESRRVARPASSVSATANSVDVQRSQSRVTMIPTSDMPSMLNYRSMKPSVMFHGQQRDVLTTNIAAQAKEDVIIRGQSPGGQYSPVPLPGPRNQVYEGSPYANQFQEIPPGWVDINVAATEGRTGRLMFGAGVNSDAGIVGSFVWDERNFNLFAPPRSWADIVDGRAWRGGGQRFRLEAAPGDQVSRYTARWTDPYFLYSDYSLGVSGYYFNRFYPDWDETRLGGDISLGKQLSPEWSIGGKIKLEQVDIANPRVVGNTNQSVPDLEAIRGDSFLSTFRVSVTNDTRDSQLMPTRGYYVNGAYEQAFGDFSYPRFEGDARSYFTLYERPDGSGRHVFTLAGVLGWSGDDTPAFERYYAGGFQSFRGYAFRGVTPRGADQIAVGGNFQALGTAEYRIPLTADDMMNLVVFSDFGTVESDVSLDDFRVTVGVGLRVVVPAMGPVPLAFDFGFPVRSLADDDERIFSFYVGINR